MWMRIGGAPWDEAVWRAVDGANLLQQGSHVPGSRGSRRSESRIYAQASDRRDQGPSPVGVTDDYAQQMEDTSQLDRLPPEWIQCLDWRSVWSLFVCGRTTAL